MPLSRLVQGLLVAIASVVVLVYTKTILIPFVLAAIVWYIIRLVQLRMARFRFHGKPLPRWLRGSLAFGISVLVLAGVASLLTANMRGIAEVLPAYEQNLRTLRAELESRTGLDLMRRMDHAVSGIDFARVLTAVLNSLTALLGNGFLVLVYVAFILLEERHARDKLLALYADGGRRDRIGTILRKVDDSLGRYVTLKTGVSLLTGTLSYVALLIIGVDFAFFWATLIFLLNYIPTIGSLVATLFPAVIAGVQYGAFGPALWVLGTVGIIQALVGNVLEPRLMGNSLNVSPLVVLLALTFWGGLWGIVGMVLSVPITVTLVIVLAQFPQTRWLAVLLSEKGKVDLEK